MAVTAISQSNPTLTLLDHPHRGDYWCRFGAAQGDEVVVAGVAVVAGVFLDCCDAGGGREV